MAEDERHSDGWVEYQRLVLAELERHSRWLATLDEKLEEIRVEIAMLKVKSGIWGGIAGLVAVAAALGIKLVAR